MRYKIQNKIIVVVLIVFMIVSAIPAHTYARENQNVFDNSLEKNQNDVQEKEVTEENNFIYDILDEMLEELEEDEISGSKENEGISLLWGNDKENKNNYGHYTSSGYAGQTVYLDENNI